MSETAANGSAEVAANLTAAEHGQGEGLEHSATTEAHGGAAHAEPTAIFMDATGWVSLAMAVFLGILIWKKVPGVIGSALDKKIAEQKPNTRSDASDNRIMLGMVSRERVDYMIMAEEEAQDLLAKPDFTDAGLAIYHLADPPAGEHRYLMCSKAVPDALIARINRAIPPIP